VNFEQKSQENLFFFQKYACFKLLFYSFNVFFFFLPVHPFLMSDFVLLLFDFK